jgi:hypothetical protein
LKEKVCTKCKKCEIALGKERLIFGPARRETAIIDGDKKRCLDRGPVCGKKKCIKCGKLMESYLFLSQSGRVCVYCQPKLERKRVKDCIGPDWIRITATPRRDRP